MVCPICQKEAVDPTTTCDDCGYPFSGTEAFKAKFIADQIIKASDIADAKESVQTAQYILFFAGGLTALLAVMWSVDMFEMILNLLLAIVFIVFAILVKSRPLLYMSIALTLLILGYVMQAIEDPATLTYFPKVKALLAVALIYGIRMTWLGRKYQKESQYLSKQ